MKTNRILLVVLLTIAALFSGCAGDKVVSKKAASAEQKSYASMALTSPSGDIVTGDIVISKGGIPFTTVYTDGSRPRHEILLQPGNDYTVAMAPGFTCTPVASTIPQGATYASCELSGAPIAFKVDAGKTTIVVLTFVFRFSGAADVSILFTVGSAEIGMGTPQDGGTTQICGSTGVACASNQKCATVNNSAVGCFTLCTVNSDICFSSQSCLPVATMQVILSYPQPPLTDLDKLCVYPSDAGAGGTSGSGGTAGSSNGGSGTGGTPSTGGTSATGGMPSTGGSSTTGGMAALTGGTTSASTGGTSPSTGGSATNSTGGASPLMSCSVPGMTTTCSTDSCVAGVIACGWDSLNNLTWGGCVCLTGSGGNASSSTGGMSATGGSPPATGGTSTGTNAIVRIELTPPQALSNGTAYQSAGNPYVNAWYTSFSWGKFCELTAVAGSDLLACEKAVPRNLDFNFQVNLLIPLGLGGCDYTEPPQPANTALVFCYDRAPNTCGGNGAFLCTARVFVDGVEVVVEARDKDTGKLDCTDVYCNAHAHT